MIDSRVRRELFSKRKVSPAALSQQAKRIKDKYGPMTTNEAYYVIAHIEGIDLSKYLSLETLDRIRALVPRRITTTTKTVSIKKGKIQKKREQKVYPTYPLITRSFIQEATKLGEEAFPQLIILENSIRNLIEKILSAVQSDWWTALVPSPVQNDVQRLIRKEKKYPYREKRGNKPLMYCNFIDLKKIILENKNHFAAIIIDFIWFEARMDEIYMARNNLAHSILLSKEDISRIALFYKEWGRVLETAQQSQLI